MEETKNAKYFIRDGILYKSCPSCSINEGRDIFYQCPDFFGFRKNGLYSQSQCTKCRGRNNSGPFSDYVFKETSDKLIPEIRALPMGKNEFSDIDDCRFFLTEEMPERGNTFYYRTHNLVTSYNSLVLFQFDGKIIAYGFFETEKEEIDGIYKGYYKFIEKSVKFLDVPITNQEMIEMFNVRLGQGTVKVPLNYLPKLFELFNRCEENINIDVLEKYNETRVKTVSDWIKVLNEEKKREQNKILKIFEFLYGQKDFTSNAAKIAIYLDQEGNMPNLDIVHFGKRVINLIGIKEMHRIDRDNLIYWNIPFITVPSLNKGVFTYKLRPELVKAIETLFPHWKKDVDEPLFNVEKELRKAKKREIFTLNKEVKLNEVNLNIVEYKETDRTITDDIEKTPNYAARVVETAINSHDGRVIEDYVFNLEYDKLKNVISENQLKEMTDFYYGRKDRYGFDILSFELKNGEYVKKYIEVKSTHKNNKAPIDISNNEVQYAKEHIDSYYIYRVIIIDNSNLHICVISGQDLFKNYDIVPTKFKIYGKTN